VIDKLHRQPVEVSVEKLQTAGVSMAAAIVEVMRQAKDLSDINVDVGGDLAPIAAELGRYMERLTDLGVRDWVTLDLTIVRGLAYYTGIVFELFDAKGELRAICGGGRYDTLLGSLGGADLPALGFGMGDVVLTELLRDRGLNVTVDSPDFWVASTVDGDDPNVLRTAAALRRLGSSVEYALRKQQLAKQRKAAQSAGATYFVTLEDGFSQSGAIRVEELGERGASAEPSSLMKALAPRPSTLDSLSTVLRDNPRMLI
jgi:histidyl-tRNA synthetase